jgi:hypothetical protein
MKMSKIKIFLGCLIVAGLLAGCSSEAKDDVSSEQLITEVAQTVQAAYFMTASAAPAPTNTIAPENNNTPTPSNATVTPLPTLAVKQVVPTVAGVSSSSSTCDVAGFVSDVTISDGTTLGASDSFTKTWKLRNDGTCTWNSNYKIAFYSGNQMSGPSSKQLMDSGVTVAPGGTLEVSVSLTAPSTAGTYVSYWVLKNASSTNFAIGTAGQPFYVYIKVGATSTPTITKTGTATSTDTDETATETDEPTATKTKTPKATAVPTDEPTATTAPTDTSEPTSVPEATEAPTAEGGGG